MGYGINKKGDKMDNITILNQLLNGYHLNNKELKKAKKIIKLLNNEIQIRKGIK